MTISQVTLDLAKKMLELVSSKKEPDMAGIGIFTIGKTERIVAIPFGKVFCLNEAVLTTEGRVEVSEKTVAGLVRNFDPENLRASYKGKGHLAKVFMINKEAA